MSKLKNITGSSCSDSHSSQHLFKQSFCFLFTNLKLLNIFLRKEDKKNAEKSSLGFIMSNSLMKFLRKRKKILEEVIMKKNQLLAMWHKNQPGS